MLQTIDIEVVEDDEHDGIGDVDDEHDELEDVDEDERIG